MDENKFRTIAQEVYDQNQAKNQNTTFVVPKHIHNGVDAPRINQDNIDAGTYSMINLLSNTSETFTIETFPNIDHITLYGIAYDDLGRKAVVSGSAFIGNCFQYGAQAGQYLTLVGGQYSNIIQTSNSAYFDTTGAFNTTDVRVGAAGSISQGSDYILSVADAVNDVATMQILSWTNNTITFQTVLAANWSINFYLSMS